MPQAPDEAGNIWEVDEQGNALYLVQQAQGEQPPVDPSFQYEGQKAEAQARGAQAGAAIQSAQVPYAAQVAQAEAQKAEASVAKSRLDIEKARMDIDKARLDMQQGKDPEAAVRAAKSILRILDSEGGVADQFENNFQNQGLFGTLNEYNPLRDENATFDADAGFLKPASKKLFRAKGEGSQSDAEGRDYNNLVPNSANRDATNERLIQHLRQEATATLEEYGEPTPKFNSADTAAPSGGGNQDFGIMVDPTQADADGIIRNPAPNTGGPTTPALGAAEFGAETQSIPVPDEMQKEHAAFMQRWQSNPDVDSYLKFRRSLDEKYGFGGDQAWVKRHRDYAENLSSQIRAGERFNFGPISPTEVPLTGVDKLRHNIASNPVGAAVTNAADMGSFGVVSALAPEQMAAMRADNPVSSTLGQIAGAMTGTGALGAATRTLAKKAAPKLLGGGGKAQFGRNLATDVGYAGTHGAVTGQDPLESAAFGALGSVGGQALGKGLQKVVGGVNLDPAAKALRKRGVPLTVGRVMGPTASKIEDKMSSIPIAGDMVARRQTDAFEAFNKAAFEEAGAPIGYTPKGTGPAGLDDMRSAIGDAYDNTLAGRQFPVDDSFVDDLGAAYTHRNQLPDDLAARFDKKMGNLADPVGEAGVMTGDQYQRAMRGLTSARSKAATTAGEFDKEYRAAATAGMDAFTNLAGRQGGGDVVDGLSRANKAYTNLGILENAVPRARNGTRSGEIDIFAPSQLNDAAHAARKYGGQELSAFAKQGQKVLPSTVPNSGTADRAWQAGLGATALGGAGGIDYATDGDSNMLGKTAAALALLTAGGSKVGQKAATKALVDRPELLQHLGNSINRRTGLFGAGAMPFALPQP